MSHLIDNDYPVYGAGLGLRRVHFDSLAARIPSAIDFMEVAPGKLDRCWWFNGSPIQGKSPKKFPSFVTDYHLILVARHRCMRNFCSVFKQFLDEFNVCCYSEHLSYCADDGHIYDLMPIPFTEEAIQHVADRIMRTQDIIGQRIAVENVSYYAAPGQELEEIEFINAVLNKADCYLLLDVNNIYVNSINHKYDAEEFLKALPGERIAYAHIAGHAYHSEDIRVDTHGDNVVDPVWQLLELAYDHFGVFPTLLERDFNIPPLTEILKEVATINRYQQNYYSIYDEYPARNYA